MIFCPGQIKRSLSWRRQLLKNGCSRPSLNGVHGPKAAQTGTKQSFECSWQLCLQTDTNGGMFQSSQSFIKTWENNLRISKGHTVAAEIARAIDASCFGSPVRFWLVTVSSVSFTPRHGQSVAKVVRLRHELWSQQRSQGTQISALLQSGLQARLKVHAKCQTWTVSSSNQSNHNTVAVAGTHFRANTEQWHLDGLITNWNILKLTRPCYTRRINMSSWDCCHMTFSDIIMVVIIIISSNNKIIFTFVSALFRGEPIRWGAIPAQLSQGRYPHCFKHGVVSRKRYVWFAWLSSTYLKYDVHLIWPIFS